MQRRHDVRGTRRRVSPLEVMPCECVASFASRPSDDDALFCAYTILQHKPHVVTCFESHVQPARGHAGCSQEIRAAETQRALLHLGASGWQQLPVRDDAVDEEMLRALLEQIEAERSWDVVFAPAHEEGAHSQHNLVADLALEVFGPLRLVSYMTYVRGQGRSQSENEVIPEPGWRALKMRAMAEYSSQVELSDTLPWFQDEWHREFLA